MARRATRIKAARAQAQHVLVLDAGNSLIGERAYGGEPANPTYGQTSVEALNRLGYDAVALGDVDLLLGRDELLKRLAEAKGFSFLSANLQDSSTGELLAAPHVIREIGGHQVALIGITGRLPEGAAEFALLPPMDAVREQVRQVEAQAGIIILLSNAGADVNQAIAREVPGIDLIVSGGQVPLPRPPQVGEGTLVVQAGVSSVGNAGRLVGELQAQFNASGELLQHTWQVVELTPSVADDREIAAWVAGIPR